MEPTNQNKRRPPRLTSTDRSHSVAIDNYVPPLTVTSLKSFEPPILIPPLKEPIPNRAKIFYMGHSTNPIVQDDPFHAHHMPRKPAIRRSDTLNVHSSDMFEMKKTYSFHASDKSPQIGSKRAVSMRHSSIHPNEFKYIDIGGKISPNELPQLETSATANRRNCNMHRSFKEQARKPEQRKEIIIESFKCHSLGDEADVLPTDVKHKLSPKFSSANSSLEKDIYRSRSNSRNQLTPTDPDFDAIESINRKHSSQSLEEKQYNFQRGTRFSHSVYLNPNTPNELPTQTTIKSGNSPRPIHEKRQHSSSMRTRPYRETLATTKKSKSFISESHHGFERSPVAANRRDSKIFATIEDLKRSPRLSAGNTLLTPDSILSISDSRKSSNMDISEMDYNAIIRLYQENRRKSSALPLGGDLKTTKKKSLDITDDDDENNDNDEFMRKRKKIVCIIVTVFLSLVFASVFVVVFTLTHSIDAQVQNQTKKVYTFSRDRDMPIHYNGN